MTKKTHHQEETWRYFEQNPLTHSAAHYLMTVRDLREEQGYARLTDVAKKLDISPGSCSTTIKTLVKKGWIEEDKNKFFSLSETGTKLVNLVIQNDELLTIFLRDVLGVSEKQAEIDACKMEHLLSPESSMKLAEFIHLMQSETKTAKDLMCELHQQEPSCHHKPKDCKVCEKKCLLAKE